MEPVFIMPAWLTYLVQGLMLFLGIACAAITLSRAGRSPYWAFLIVVPFVQIVAIWVFAYIAWPRRAT